MTDKLFMIAQEFDYEKDNIAAQIVEILATLDVGVGELESNAQYKGWLDAINLAVPTEPRFGAAGDNITDDQAELVAAFASGQPVLIHKPYYIASTLNIPAGANVIFWPGGTIKPANGVAVNINREAKVAYAPGAQAFDLSLGGTLRSTSGFGSDNRGGGLKISSYISSDSTVPATAGFKQAIKDLFNLNVYTLDLEGRRIIIDNEIDMAALTGITSKSVWKRITNGYIDTTGFDVNAPETNGTVASVSFTANSAVATMASTANLKAGMEVTAGTRLPRGTFVQSIDSATQITLSKSSMTTGSSTLSWWRRRYVLDFSGFTALSRFTMDNLYINLQTNASFYLSSMNDDIVEFKNCRFVNPKRFCINQFALGGGMVIEGCDFISDEAATAPHLRTRIACILNGDCRVANNRWAFFLHAAIFDGYASQIVGNHPFAGSGGVSATHMANFVFQQGGDLVIVGNYIDNGWLEFTNELYAGNASASIGGFNVSGNRFVTKTSDAAYAFIVIKPYNAAAPLNGIIIANNTFKPLTGGGGVAITAATKLDTTAGNIDTATPEDIYMGNNSFKNCGRQENPARVKSTVNSGLNVAQSFANKFPFNLAPKTFMGAAVTGPDNIGATRCTAIAGNNVTVNWSTAPTLNTDILTQASCVATVAT